MSLVIGYNESDVTYGWDGSPKGFSLYFSHFTVEHMMPDKKIPLSDGLMPVVMFKTIKRQYLGAPFTDCNNNTHAINEYNKSDLTTHDYSQRYGIKF